MPSRPSAYRPSGAELVGLLTVVVLLVGGYWWTHPKVLFYGDEESFELTIGQTAVFDVADHLSGYDETIHVLSVEPRTVRDETGARYEFLTCVLEDPDGGLGTGYESDVPKFCASTTPAAGRPFGLQDGSRSQILMKVTATKPGRLDIDGADVTYRRSGEHLFQTGTQQSGTALRLIAK